MYSCTFLYVLCVSAIKQRTNLNSIKSTDQHSLGRLLLDMMLELRAFEWGIQQSPVARQDGGLCAVLVVVRKVIRGDKGRITGKKLPTLGSDRRAEMYRLRPQKQIGAEHAGLVKPCEGLCSVVLRVIERF